ncbi:hypothetical protein B0H12DRAFT_326864 [Mycena haematopus]|nr:hypothetical protein B0H12DRAFT_326864 [Mycena haematopus]
MSAPGGSTASETPSKRRADNSPGSLRDDNDAKDTISGWDSDSPLTPSPASPRSPNDISPSASKAKRRATGPHSGISRIRQPAIRPITAFSLPPRIPSQTKSVHWKLEVEPQTRWTAFDPKSSFSEDDSDMESEDEPQTRVIDSDLDDCESDSSTDDPKDGDYTEGPSKVPKINGPGVSPYKRSVGNKSAPSIQKKRVKDADPNHAVCLLTNAATPTTARQFSHVLERSTSHAILTILEWWWQMEYWTLYIDTRFNIFALRADWHLAMDGGDWALVPKHDLITQVLKWTEEVMGRDPAALEKRRPISQMFRKQAKFQYYMLPLSPQMKHTELHRFPEPSENFDPVAIVPRAVSVLHTHPFSTIGPLTSHVHPHFVIYSVGQKLANLTENMNRADSDALYSDLAVAASFGHEADEMRPVTVKNRDSIDTLISLYRTWSKTDGVPPRGDKAWRQHPEAPSEAQEKAAAEKARKKKAAAKKAKEEETARRMAAAAAKNAKRTNVAVQTKGKGKAKAEASAQ